MNCERKEDQIEIIPQKFSPKKLKGLYLKHGPLMTNTRRANPQTTEKYIGLPTKAKLL